MNDTSEAKNKEIADLKRKLISSDHLANIYRQNTIDLIQAQAEDLPNIVTLKEHANVLAEKLTRAFDLLDTIYYDTLPIMDEKLKIFSEGVATVVVKIRTNSHRAKEDIRKTLSKWEEYKKETP